MIRRLSNKVLVIRFSRTGSANYRPRYIFGSKVSIIRTLHIRLQSMSNRCNRISVLICGSGNGVAMTATNILMLYVVAWVGRITPNTNRQYHYLPSRFITEWYIYQILESYYTLHLKEADMNGSWKNRLLTPYFNKKFSNLFYWIQPSMLSIKPKSADYEKTRCTNRFNDLEKGFPPIRRLDKYFLMLNFG